MSETQAAEKVKLTVGKGKTTRPGDQEEWLREYYEISVVVDDLNELSVARANLLGLIDGWLTQTSKLEKTAPPEAKHSKEDFDKPSWDPSKIKWKEAEGPRGKFERSEDINNLDFKALVKCLAEHKGKLTHEGYFYWLFENGATVGRKKRLH